MIINLTISNVSLSELQQVINIVNAKQEEKLNAKHYAYALPTQVTPDNKACHTQPTLKKRYIKRKERSPRATLKEMALRASYEREHKHAVNWLDLSNRTAIMIGLNFNIYTQDFID